MKKILIIDDCKVTVEMIRKVLLSNGYDVDYVHDGVSGVATAENWRPDLIILDIIMPGLDGLSLLSQLRNTPETKDIPVIIHSSKAQMKELFAYKKGVIAFLEKPFEEETLLRTIRTALG
jgi:CheY-like chemotaxis protein